MRRVQALAYLLCAAASRFAFGDAFTVTTERVHGMDPTDTHRVLQQRYWVSQSLVDSVINPEALQTLKISMPGRVFVSYNYDLGSPPPESLGEWQRAPAATIRFSGNSQEIFKYYEVVSTAPHTVEVRRRSNVHGTISDAYLLTEISVTQSHSISEIVAKSSGDVVIEDQVLVFDGQRPLKVTASGSGSVYIDAKSTSLTSAVEIASSGSGDVFWSGAAMQMQSLKLELSGSGDVTLMNQKIDTTALEVDIAGSGDICVDASEIKTNTLFTATAGSGTISFSTPSGQCSREDITILGSGEVYAGAIQCNDVKISVAGSGDIYVQAVHSITGTAWGSGDVKFVGGTPQLISDRYDANAFSKEQSKSYHPIAKHKDRNKSMPCKPKTVPLRAAVHVHGSFLEAGSTAILGPLVFFALLSVCYLRSQGKRSRRHSQRVPRYGSYRSSGQELQPLQPHYQQVPYQQQQSQSTQVYV